MSHVKVVTLPQIGDGSIVCKTKRDISVETPLDKRDDESLGWGYWDRIWPSEVALSEYLIHQFFPKTMAGIKVLEIGCGTGLAGVREASGCRRAATLPWWGSLGLAPSSGLPLPSSGGFVRSCGLLSASCASSPWGDRPRAHQASNRRRLPQVRNKLPHDCSLLELCRPFIWLDGPLGQSVGPPPPEHTQEYCRSSDKEEAPLFKEMSVKPRSDKISLPHNNKEPEQGKGEQKVSESFSRYTYCKCGF